MSTTTKKFSGWSVLVGCACLMFFGNAIIAGTTSLFMAPICQSLSFDVAAYSVILLISSLAAAVSSMILAPYMQKGNMKMIMLACAIIAALSYAGMGLCTQLWQFYVLFGICNLGYGAITQLPVAMLITAWFDDKRSVAMSMAFVGNNLGCAVWSMIFSKIIASDPMGWTKCYFLGGAVILVVDCLVILFLVKKSPQSVGQEAYIQENKKSSDKQAVAKPRDNWEGVSKGVAFKSVGFFALAALILLLGCAVTGVTSHVLNYLVTLGWTTTEAGNVFSVFSLLGIIGLLAGGVLFEKVGLRNGITIGCISYILAIVSLFFAKQTMFGYAYAVFFALGNMMPRLVPTLLTSTVFGTKDYASIYAILNMLFLVGCSLGGPLTGILYNMSGKSYALPWIVYIVFIALIIVCTVVALIDGKKLREKYPTAA